MTMRGQLQAGNNPISGLGVSPDQIGEKDPKIAEMLQANCRWKLAVLCVLDSDVDTLWKSLKQVLFSTAEDVLGRQGWKILSWVKNEVLNLCDQRQQLRQQKHISTEAGLEYRKLNREVRKEIRQQRKSGLRSSARI